MVRSSNLVITIGMRELGATLGVSLIELTQGLQWLNATMLSRPSPPDIKRAGRANPRAHRPGEAHRSRIDRMWCATGLRSQLA